MTHPNGDTPGLGIVMLNLGGPRTLDEVGPFLTELFDDREIIKLPAQSRLGPFIARRRTPKVQRLYEEIGGGSPLLDWTRRQGEMMVEGLDRQQPATAPHRFYVGFRYAQPNTEDALRRMRADGVRRAVAFTQYPQFSCATTGSSLNELWRAVERLGMTDDFTWSVVDDWYSHPAYLDALAGTVRDGLAMFDEQRRDQVHVLFSAHSLPTAVINRGDPYPQHVGATVQAVVERLDLPNPYVLTYQSKVGPVSWQGPSTVGTVQNLGRRGVQDVLVVGVTFTSDHIETLSEIDIELARDAYRAGVVRFHRAPALNDRPDFGAAMATVVADHLAAKRVSSPQYSHPCPGCTNGDCRRVVNPAC
jgi:protoporphyrin/coproporphyrin ferrochelatase